MSRITIVLLAVAIGIPVGMGMTGCSGEEKRGEGPDPTPGALNSTPPATTPKIPRAPKDPAWLTAMEKDMDKKAKATARKHAAKKTTIEKRERSPSQPRPRPVEDPYVAPKTDTYAPEVEDDTYRYVDPTPEKLDGTSSDEFEPDDIDRAEGASDSVQDYCADAVSEAQRIGCESHVTESDIP